MKKNGFQPKKQLISLAILIVLIVATYALLHQILKFDLPVILETIRGLKVPYLLLAVLCLLLYVLAEGRAMAAVGKVLGVKIGWRRAFYYGSADMYYSAITPSATGGQPAVAYYMNRDGIPYATSSVILLVTTCAYIVGLVIFGVVAAITNFRFVLESTLAVKILFGVGMFMNLSLVAICLLAMFCRPLIRWLMVWCIRFLAKIRLCRSKEERIAKLDSQLDEYASCVQLVKTHPLMLFKALGLTMLQRFFFIMIAYFVYCSFGIHDSTTMLNIISIQIFIAIAVNSLPLPGAVGISEIVFEWLYLKIYTADLITPAMLVTRGINFYLCFVVCGITTLVYHLYQNRRLKGAPPS